LFGNISSTILGGGYRENNDEGRREDIKLNYSDDENLEDYGGDWLRMD
jgi:hypothetical protein